MPFPIHHRCGMPAAGPSPLYLDAARRDANYSVRWKEIKRLFSKEYGKVAGSNAVLSPSRKKRKEAAIWQRRFWEHTIRDEVDYNRHLDYIHYNPVKHNL